MTISPGTRTLYAYFSSRVAARQAAEALQEQGFDLPQIDRTDRYAMDEFIGSSTLHPEGSGDVLGEVDFDHDFFFTLRTTDDKVTKAMEIITRHGGIV